MVASAFDGSVAGVVMTLLKDCSPTKEAVDRIRRTIDRAERHS